MRTKFILLTLFLTLFFTNYTEAKPKKLDVQASPVSFSLFQKSKIHFDKLIFRGGLELSSNNKEFGGLSGLVMGPLGKKMIAVSDRGRWFGAQVEYKDGKISGLTHVLFDRLTNQSGSVLRGKGKKDAESITTARSDTLAGGVLVAFERQEKLHFYKVRGTKILSPAQKLPLPHKIKDGPHNKELETVVRFHKGQLKGHVLIFSENHRDKRNNIIGWILKGKNHSQISVKARGDFFVTDAAILPNGDLLLLERAVSRLTGLSMQIRLVKQNTIKPGAILDGDILLQASQLMMIDNMEGMSVHKDTRGKTILSLISDDNFQKFQRTLLLQFEIPKNVYSGTAQKK